jgi:ATP-binding cassette, subfamily C, bacteriocin exporter
MIAFLLRFAVFIHVTKMKPDFVCIRQQTAADCGAACLATIAHTYQHDYSFESLRQRIPTDAQGATLLAVVEAARQSGFDAQGILTDLAAVPQLPLPCIAHLTGQTINHFVVIHQCDNETLSVADPAQGLIRYKLADFAQLWSGALIILTPPANDTHHSCE